MKRFFILWLVFFLAMSSGAARAENALSPDPNIGAGFGVQVKEWRTSSQELDEIKDMGAQYLRFGFVWDAVEKSRGVYDFSAADYFMKKLQSRDFHVVYEVGGMNPLYSPMVDTTPNTPTDQGQQELAAPTSPKALAAMEAFIAETVRRYHGDHVIWEIWNEPDMNSNWPPEVSADQFAKVISKTCATIKQVDPDAVVVGPALAYLPARDDNGHKNFLATILKSPAGACLDAVSVHPYRHRAQPPETVIKDYANLRAYIAANTLPANKILPVISSEWGYSLAEVTPEQQAAYALRSLIINRLSGIPVSIWYEWRDSFDDSETEIGKMDRESHFGLNDFDDGEKPSAKVVEEVLPHLLDARLEKRIAVADDKVYVLSLVNAGGQHLLLFWLADSVVKRKLGLAIGSGSESKVYPVDIVPTLVCTDAVPAAALAAAPEQQDEDQRHYFQCPQ